MAPRSADRRSSPAAARSSALIAGAAGRAVGPRARPSAARRRSTATLYVTSGSTLKRLTIGYTALAADLVLDSRASVLRRHQAAARSVGCRASAERRADAVPASHQQSTTRRRPVTYGCCIRCSISRPPSIRSSTSPIASARFFSPSRTRRRRPARPGDRAARKGTASQARQVGVHAGHRLRALLVAARLQGRGRLVRPGAAECRARRGGCGRWRRRRWPKAATASRRASCGSRSGSPPTTTGCTTTPSAA